MMDNESAKIEQPPTVCPIGGEEHPSDETWCMQHQSGTYKAKTHQKQPGRPMQGPVSDTQTF